MPLTPLRLPSTLPSLVSLKCQGQSAWLPGWSSAVLLQPIPQGPWKSPSTECLSLAILLRHPPTPSRVASHLSEGFGGADVFNPFFTLENVTVTKASTVTLPPPAHRIPGRKACA